MSGNFQPSMASLAWQQYEKRTEIDRDPLVGFDKARSETEEEEVRILLIRLAQGDSTATWKPSSPV